MLENAKKKFWGGPTPFFGVKFVPCPENFLRFLEWTSGTKIVPNRDPVSCTVWNLQAVKHGQKHKKNRKNLKSQKNFIETKKKQKWSGTSETSRNEEKNIC